MAYRLNIRLNALLGAAVLVAVLGLSLPATADMTIGNCKFYGDKPSREISIGGMRVMHNGTGRVTRTVGKKRFFETKGGNIWVIFSKRSQMEEYVFLGGSVQTCTAYMR